MNFVEGTRFTAAKHAQQQSPYQHLLRPKAAGIAFVLGAMGGQLRSILNVTVVYPGGARELWDFLCGRVKMFLEWSCPSFLQLRFQLISSDSAKYSSKISDHRDQRTFQL